ncbi:MAG: hypothetical protein ACLRSW_14845 [Christensenellaceae bacterium]
MKNEYSEITPYIRKLAELSNRSNGILPEMYAQHKVTEACASSGNGVVTGHISNIRPRKKRPTDGHSRKGDCFTVDQRHRRF